MALGLMSVDSPDDIHHCHCAPTRSTAVMSQRTQPLGMILRGRLLSETLHRDSRTRDEMRGDEMRGDEMRGDEMRGRCDGASPFPLPPAPACHGAP